MVARNLTLRYAMLDGCSLSTSLIERRRNTALGPVSSAMSENRDHTGRGNPASAAVKGPEQSAHDAHNAQDQSPRVPARLVNPASEVESTQPSQVLMQRVIALSGVVEIPEGARARARQQASALRAEPGQVAEKDPRRALVDLSSTALEWGVRQPVRITTKASKPAVPLQEPDAAQPEQIEIEASLDAEWATHSSISLELCDELRLSRSMLSANIEDAVTQQYTPRASSGVLASGSSIHDLASLDRVLEAEGAREAQELLLIAKLREAPAPAAPAPAVAPPAVAPPAAVAPPVSPGPTSAPRMLVVPTSVAWTVAGGFAVCTMVLSYLLASSLVCGQSSFFDPIHLRCIARANVAQAR